MAFSLLSSVRLNTSTDLQCELLNCFSWLSFRTSSCIDWECSRSLQPRNYFTSLACFSFFFSITLFLLFFSLAYTFTVASTAMKFQSTLHLTIPNKMLCEQFASALTFRIHHSQSQSSSTCLELWEVSFVQWRKICFQIEIDSTRAKENNFLGQRRSFFSCTISRETSSIFDDSTRRRLPGFALFIISTLTLQF